MIAPRVLNADFALAWAVPERACTESRLRSGAVPHDRAEFLALLHGREPPPFTK